jgi:two-component system phosphate regulon response regulator PhoB
MSEKIIVVDDETDVADLIAFHLKKANYNVLTAADGAEALELIRREMPALIVLDLMLPGVSGLEVCRALKSDPKTTRIPVIMLTAKAEEVDRIVGFELGADDYVVKPFSPREFVLRVNAVVRRNTGANIADRLVAGEITVDRTKHLVLVAGAAIDCTATEFKLISILIERRGRVQSRDRLLADVWGYQAAIDTRTVDTHMRRLREKLGKYGVYLETVRGFGYRIGEELAPV